MNFSRLHGEVHIVVSIMRITRDGEGFRRRFQRSGVHSLSWGSDRESFEDSIGYFVFVCTVCVRVLCNFSPVQLFVTTWTATCQSSLSFSISQSLHKLMSTELVMPSNHLILCCPLLLLPSIFPSIRVFFNKLTLCIRWPKFWSFNFSISPSNEYSGLISFRIDCFDLLAVQGTLKSLLQHPNSKVSILQGSVFFMVQLSHPFMTTGKIMAVTVWTFVGKVMSLLFRTLFRFVITFLSRNKCLLISCLQSPSAVILKPPKIKSVTVSTFSPSIFHEVM